MVNIETVKFIKAVEELAQLSNNGIKPFTEATLENRNDFVFYDKNKKNINGSYKICLDMCLAENHHDVISYYEDYKGISNSINEFIYGVIIDDDGNKYIEIKLNDDEYIIVEDGKWYLA